MRFFIAECTDLPHKAYNFGGGLTNLFVTIPCGNFALSACQEKLVSCRKLTIKFSTSEKHIFSI